MKHKSGSIQYPFHFPSPFFLCERKTTEDEEAYTQKADKARGKIKSEAFYWQQLKSDDKAEMGEMLREDTAPFNLRSNGERFTSELLVFDCAK